MKSIWNNKSGFTLINVVIGLIIVSLTIVITVNFNSYISRENQINKEEFSFYTQVNNLVEEIYSLDWDDLELANNENNSIKLSNSKSVDYEYEFFNQATPYGTRKLNIIFHNPPGTNSEEFIYKLEKLEKLKIEK